MAFAVLFTAVAAAALPARPEPSIDDILGAVVRVQSTIDPAARTVKTLGLEREGHGVVIDSSGLVLTIGYLILEANAVTVTNAQGAVQPARVIAYDHNTGFGLVRTARPLSARPLRLGDSTALAVDSDVVVVGFGGAENAIRAKVVDRRDFAGYWEYLLPNAIFTQPPFRVFGGAALIDPAGKLVGIGSLFVGDARPGPAMSPGNMFVPIEALKPILGQLIAKGRSDAPRRAWVGIHTEEHRNRVFVARLAVGGPGVAAGVVAGDIITAVGGKPIRGQIDFYRKVWALGAPGAAVPLTVLRQDGALAEITVLSRDRHDWLRLGAGN